MILITIRSYDFINFN